MFWCEHCVPLFVSNKTKWMDWTRSFSVGALHFWTLGSHWSRKHQHWPVIGQSVKSSPVWFLSRFVLTLQEPIICLALVTSTLSPSAKKICSLWTERFSKFVWNICDLYWAPFITITSLGLYVYWRDKKILYLKSWKLEPSQITSCGWLRVNPRWLIRRSGPSQQILRTLMDQWLYWGLWWTREKNHDDDDDDDYI